MIAEEAAFLQQMNARSASRSADERFSRRQTGTDDRGVSNGFWTEEELRVEEELAFQATHKVPEWSDEDRFSSEEDDSGDGGDDRTADEQHEESGFWDSDDLEETTLVEYTEDAIILMGLQMMGYKEERNRVAKSTKLRRFRSGFGSDPNVIAKIFRDLQLAKSRKARIKGKRVCMWRFLVAVNFLKVYDTEEQRAGNCKLSEKSVRKWSWYYVKKICALKKEKIVWPKNIREGEGIVFVCTVDGAHFRVLEPGHPTKPKNKKWFSHKFEMAGCTYEIAISVFENKVLWINGPFKAGKGDLAMFGEENGLHSMIPAGKKVIADNVYICQQFKNLVSTSSSADPKELRRLKARAKARHETFNKRMKVFGCLSQTFRHSVKKHKCVFEAVCVICQYQMENGSPLFDV